MENIEKIKVSGHYLLTVDQLEAALALTLILRQAGHAVNFSTTVSSAGRLVRVEVTHYLTCERCKQDTLDSLRFSRVGGQAVDKLP